MVDADAVRKALRQVKDPEIGLSNLRPIGRLLADSSVEVVFHDADYDLRVLDRDYGFRAKRVFDTRIAAQLLGEPSVGLGPLLEKYFGIVKHDFHRGVGQQATGFT